MSSRNSSIYGLPPFNVQAAPLCEDERINWTACSKSRSMHFAQILTANHISNRSTFVSSAKALAQKWPVLTKIYSEARKKTRLLELLLGELITTESLSNVDLMRTLFAFRISP